MPCVSLQRKTSKFQEYDSDLDAHLLELGFLCENPDDVGSASASFVYNAHGSMTSMPHLSAMDRDFAEKLSHITRGTTEVYYSYDGSGIRTRKVVEKSGVVETRLYLGGFEIWRKTVNGVLDTERETLHVMDDRKRIAIVETLAVENGNRAATPVPVQRYQPDNHLGSASLELDDSANIISYEEYYPYGDTSYRAGRNASEVSRKRYRYTGKEKDEESSLYYSEQRYYAAHISRWVSTDPTWLADGINLYAYVNGNPVSGVDPSGTQTVENDENQSKFIPESKKNMGDNREKRKDSFLASDLKNSQKGKLNVISKSGELLFVLESTSSESRTITASDLYKEKVQWFEPEADNYQKLLSVSKTFTKSSSVKHFTWDDITTFAEVDRPMFFYASGFPGDWKNSSKGGDDYLMVDVEGMPYWADAIGQIPFAVDLFTDELESGKSVEDAIMTTLDEGRKHGAGQIIGGEPDTSSNYDNLMILRGALYASNRFSVSSNGKLKKNKIPANLLANPVKTRDAKNYKVKR